MYSSDVPVPVVARWCRVDIRRVWRAVDRRIGQDPGWFNRCLVVHDQPRPGTAAERRTTKTLEQAWWGHYDDLAVYMGERGGQRPRQNESPHAAELYYWSFAQRRALDAGTLATGRREVLDRLGEWTAQRNDDPEEVWDRRLAELRQFVMERGRFPVYDRVRRPGERVSG